MGTLPAARKIAALGGDFNADSKVNRHMIFIDTNVLIAAHMEEHEHHAASFAFWQQTSPHTTYAACHALAEFFSATTSLPHRKALPPHYALLCVENIKQRLQSVTLTAEDYVSAVVRTLASGGKGGRIYDALHVEAACKIGAAVLYSWNIKHFLPLVQGMRLEIRTPDHHD